eukprot:TRINITY_DN1905_c0_g1_i1.p1 TRINITY_DN1905_c0_g1~~TRINITY_DN1905_c0_g1_i1.p1  ORF type:complete len:148 (-),score=15.57 TRINITY_DN1905_c0_g1_i1:345-788(-)
MTTKTKPEILTLTGHTGSVSVVRFSPNGKWLSTGASDKTVRVYSCEGEVFTFKHTFVGHKAGINDLVWINASEFASASDDLSIIVWNIANKSAKISLTEHTDVVLTLDYNSKNGLLASGSFDLTGFGSFTLRKGIRVPHSTSHERTF